MTAQEDNDSIGLCRDKTEDEDVLGATVVAFQDGVAESRLWVELDFLVSCANEVIDDMGGRSVSASAAKPFAAS